MLTKTGILKQTCCFPNPKCFLYLNLTKPPTQYYDKKTCLKNEHKETKLEFNCGFAGRHFTNIDSCDWMASSSFNWSVMHKGVLGQPKKKRKKKIWHKGKKQAKKKYCSRWPWLSLQTHWLNGTSESALIIRKLSLFWLINTLFTYSISLTEKLWQSR